MAPFPGQVTGAKAPGSTKSKADSKIREKRALALLSKGKTMTEVRKTLQDEFGLGFGWNRLQALKKKARKGLPGKAKTDKAPREAFVWTLLHRQPWQNNRYLQDACRKEFGWGIAPKVLNAWRVALGHQTRRGLPPVMIDGSPIPHRPIVPQNGHSRRSRADQAVTRMAKAVEAAQGTAEDAQATAAAAELLRNCPFIKAILVTRTPDGQGFTANFDRIEEKIVQVRTEGTI